MRALTPTLSICALAAAFAAGALTVEPPSPPSPPAQAAPAADHAHGGTTAPADIAAEGSATAGVAADEVTITISEFAFDTPPVSPGATVRVVNLDSAPHTVTANDGSFDVFVDPGATATFVVPATPGEYTFFCSVHPSMTSSLVVT